MYEQGAVLPDPVVGAELSAVALVHVDVVDTVAGPEPEHLVGDVRLGAEPLPEEVQGGGGVGDGPLHVVVEQVGQVVVGAREVGREQSHRGGIEQVAADEVQAGLPRLRCQSRPSAAGWREQFGHRVAEVVVSQVQQLRGCLLGLDVDSGPVVGAGVVGEVDLVVRRVAGSLPAPVDCAGGQDTVFFQRHGSSFGCGGSGTAGVWSCRRGRQGGRPGGLRRLAGPPDTAAVFHGSRRVARLEACSTRAGRAWLTWMPWSMRSGWPRTQPRPRACSGHRSRRGYPHSSRR